MIITQHDAVLELPPSFMPRSEGIHLSGIIRAIAIEMKLLQESNPDDARMADLRKITDPVAILRMSIGLAWEEYYITTMLTAGGVIKHPGEVTVDSIHMTPDGMDVMARGNKYVVRLHEVKATYKSINTVGDFRSQWMWLTQAKGYCVGYQTRFVRFHVLYLCGDYKMPIRPRKIIYDIEFTEKEVNENWELLTDYHNQRQ